MAPGGYLRRESFTEGWASHASMDDLSPAEQNSRFPQPAAFPSVLSVGGRVNWRHTHSIGERPRSASSEGHICHLIVEWQFPGAARGSHTRHLVTLPNTSPQMLLSGKAPWALCAVDGRSKLLWTSGKQLAPKQHAMQSPEKVPMLEISSA